MRSNRRRTRRDTGGSSFWLSFSDLMSALLLIIILILFYVMYDAIDTSEIQLAQIARQQYDLDTAKTELNAKEKELDSQTAELAAQAEKLTEQEKQAIAQQIKLDSQAAELENTRADLKAQQEALEATNAELENAQAALNEERTKLEALKIDLQGKQDTIDAQSAALTEKQAQIDAQSASLATQQTKIDEQSASLATQQETIENQKQVLKTQTRQLEELVGLKTELISELSDALDKHDIDARVDEKTGAITLKSEVLYAYSKNELTDEGKRFIDEFLPVYLSVLFSDEYENKVAEIIVEGHTDLQGSYLFNLDLSQTRAQSVANYILSDEYSRISDEIKERLKKKITVNGKSFSDPVYSEYGAIDPDASRRVVFKFRLTDDQMIEQMREILERDSATSIGG